MEKILNFPDGYRQLGEGYCGPNAMKHIISYKLNLDVPESYLMDIGCGSVKKGVPIYGMLRIANKFNLSHHLKFDSSISDLINSIDNGNPVILDIQAWPNRKIKNWENEWEFGHYVVAIGYNKREDKLNYYDPFDGKKKKISYKKLIQRWHDWDSKRAYNRFGIFFKN